MRLSKSRRLAALAFALALAGCSGGGGGSPAPAAAAAAQSSGAASGWVSGTFLPRATFAGQCVAPRSGVDPTTNQPYVDTAGTVLSENNWLRSWTNDLYLWYSEVVDRDPGLYGTEAFFDLLKTSAMTPSGSPKDKFHFTYATDDWLALSQSGVTAGYGVEWAVVASLPPRRIVVAYTQSGPAVAANLQRGEVVLSVDGVDAVSTNTQADVDRLLAGLYPAEAGETHVFTLRNPQTSAVRSVTMQSATVTLVPVQNVKTIATAEGTVGYLQFNDHLEHAEAQLVAAIETLRQAAVDDLVIDLRYNGGGLLAIASELAYMIAGTVPTAGQTFEHLRFNDKHTSINPVTGAPLTPMPFYTTTRGFSAPSGQPLPTLDLARVFVLTGLGTCSASESIINGLRGVGVTVIQIGSTTCGKPYGFYPTDNCGTTYFTIQTVGVNAAGFGDYTDGFSPGNAIGAGGTMLPGCSVADDFAHPLGDLAEARLAAALAHRSGGSCPVPSGLSRPPGGARPLSVTASAAAAGSFKPPWRENRVLTPP
jgi:carboxyl-terminal processing protease